jgi:hypothetical protein
LRHDVSVPLTLGKPARTRQLVEEAEAHLILPDWDCRLGLPTGIADWDCRLGLPTGVAATRALSAEYHGEREPAIDGRRTEFSARP